MNKNSDFPMNPEDVAANMSTEPVANIKPSQIGHHGSITLAFPWSDQLLSFIKDADYDQLEIYVYLPSNPDHGVNIWYDAVQISELDRIYDSLINNGATVVPQKGK